MKMKNLIFIFGFLFVTLTACKDKGQEVEVEDLEAQEEAFDQQLEEMRQRNNTVDAIEGNPELSTFAAGLNVWNIEDTLDLVTGDYMVFAPTNLAYSRVYRQQGYEVLETSPQSVIPYHMVKVNYTPEELRREIRDANGSLVLSTFEGEDITFSLDGETIVLTGATGVKANVTENFSIENGTAYIIDSVLMPEGVDTEVIITTEE